MELYILSKEDLSILSIKKPSNYEINLDEETNAKSTFTLEKCEGLKKGNYIVVNGLYKQFLLIIDDVQSEKGSNIASITALDISNVFDRKVIEKDTNTMTEDSIEEFIANMISENFVNSDDPYLNKQYIDINWHTNTQGIVNTNSENGLYNAHTFITNCRQSKNICTDFKFGKDNIPEIQMTYDNEGDRYYLDGESNISRLPAEYQEVEYIESTGTQYIDTEFNPSDKTKVTADASVIRKTGYNYLFGVRGSSGWFGFMYRDINSSIYINRGKINQNDGKTTVNGTESGYRHKVEFSRDETRINNIGIWGVQTNPVEFSELDNLFIFGTNKTGYAEYMSEVKLYSMKIYENNVLVRDFVPCYRISDNVIGLYDLVDGAFYTNSGTGEFLKGNDFVLSTIDYPAEIVNTYPVGTYKTYINNKWYYITIEEDLKSVPNEIADRLWLDIENNSVEIIKKVEKTISDGVEVHCQLEEVGNIECSIDNILENNSKLIIDIEKKEDETKLIDTTVAEITDYNKVYETDVTAKVQVLIREDNSIYNLYLKTDRTTTENKNDPDRARGKIETISVDTADKAREEALNVFKGNTYNHLVEFKIAKSSKLMDITQLYIGRNVRIKTDDAIYESYISAIRLTDENFVYFKSGNLRIDLLDKLKKKNESKGNKIDCSGGKITGKLTVKELEIDNISRITDCNNLNLKTGLYYADGNTANAPFASAWFLEVLRNSENKVTTQRITRYRENTEVWQRQYWKVDGTNYSWTPWSFIGTSILTATRTSNLSVSPNSESAVTLTEMDEWVGSRFSLINGDVSIGQGINMVKISAQAWTQQTGNSHGYAWLYIQQYNENGDLIRRVANSILTVDTNNSAWLTAVISPVLIPVNSGDRFRMFLASADSTAVLQGEYYDRCVYMTVEAVR